MGTLVRGLYAALTQDPSVNARFHTRMAKYCGQALAALLVHARDRPFGEATENLTAIDACGSADPLPRAALLLRSLAGNGADRRLSGAAHVRAERGEEEMEAMVAQHGAVDLLGRGLSEE